MKRILPLLLLWLSLPLLAQTVPQLPVEAFASIPDVSSVQLSPDGKKIASIVRVEQPKLKGTVVSILDLETGEKLKVHPKQVRELYKEKMNFFYDELKIRCGQYKIDYMEVDVKNGFDTVFMAFMAKRMRGSY